MVLATFIPPLVGAEHAAWGSGQTPIVLMWEELSSVKPWTASWRISIAAVDDVKERRLIFSVIGPREPE
jgi:hypothetical protein